MLHHSLDGYANSRLRYSHELSFKAQTASDAERWWNIIREAAGEANFTGSVPSSPVESRNVSGQQAPPYQDTKQPAPVDTKNVSSTGYHGSAATPDGGSGQSGSAGGYGGMGPAPGSGSTGASPATGGQYPTSGIDRAPGQY